MQVGTYLRESVVENVLRQNHSRTKIPQNTEKNVPQINCSSWSYVGLAKTRRNNKTKRVESRRAKRRQSASCWFCNVASFYSFSRANSARLWVFLDTHNRSTSSLRPAFDLSSLDVVDVCSAVFSRTFSCSYTLAKKVVSHVSLFFRWKWATSTFDDAMVS